MDTIVKRLMENHRVNEAAWDELESLGASDDEIWNIADTLGFDGGITEEQAEKILQYYKDGKYSNESSDPDSFEYKGITVNRRYGKWVASDGNTYMSYLTPNDIKQWIDHDHMTESKKVNESASDNDLHQALRSHRIDWKVARVLDDGTAYVVTQDEILSSEELERILKPAGFTKGYTICRDYSGYNPDQDITGYKTGIKRNYWGPPEPAMYGSAFGIEKEGHYDVYPISADEDDPEESGLTIDELWDYIDSGYYIFVDTNDGEEYTSEDMRRLINWYRGDN